MVPYPLTHSGRIPGALPAPSSSLSLELGRLECWLLSRHLLGDVVRDYVADHQGHGRGLSRLLPLRLIMDVLWDLKQLVRKRRNLRKSGFNRRFYVE